MGQKDQNGYTYDPNGRRYAMTVGGEPVVKYGHDDAGRLETVSRMIGSGIRTFKISHDSGGRRKTLQIPLANGASYLSTEYGYDNANRVLSMLHTAGSATIENLTYGYDANGNRTHFSRNAAQALSPSISGTAYDEANEMLAFNGKTLTYDANGNLETKTDATGTTTYVWDARNRLIAIDGPSLSASFRYDATNRRISKTVNGTTTQYLYDGWDIVQEIKAGGKVNYVRTLNIDEPLTRLDGATTRHYVRDALSTVIGLADESGAMKTTYTYDAYGRSTATGEPSTNPFQFTGRENDGTGLLHYRYRYYSPEMQRFISEDPIGLKGGINYYNYVQNNPINWMDPLGLIIQYCNRGAHGPLALFGFNHGYLWDSETGNYYGMGGSEELGPDSDTCSDVPDSEGREGELLDALRERSREPWLPWNNCHTVIGDVLNDNGLTNPGAPGGIWGPIPNN